MNEQKTVETSTHECERMEQSSKIVPRANFSRGQPQRMRGMYSETCVRVCTLLGISIFVLTHIFSIEF